jgi:UDP-N-acetylmuramoylalanine--D-glutamate ligase
VELPDRALVVGLGMTGVSLVKFLSQKGCKVTVTDAKPEEELAPALAALDSTPFVGHFGNHARQDFLSHPLVVLSPGVDSGLPLLADARKAGVKVIGEIELAAAFIREPIIAITGTNGKTTTTTLMGRLFERAFGDVFVGGNIGNPLIEYVIGGRAARYLICEISSFQLETIERFRPETAILLNITADHLDRYPSFEAYVAAKWKVFENQTADDYALLTRDLAPSSRLAAKTLFFSTRETLQEGAFMRGGELVVRVGGQEFSYRRDLSPLVGIHNSENLLSVLLSAHLHGIDRDVIGEVIRDFKGLSHRVEFVREVGGVAFYNDSKATNVDATLRALESMGSRVILIAGGKHKGGSYRVLEPALDRVAGLVLFGEAKEIIAGELGALVPTHVEKDMADAVTRAHSLARTGDTVLFSPMCSSFDMFRDYKDRGEKFRTLVEAL